MAKQAQWVGQIFNEHERAVSIAAAYLHDIGHAPTIPQHTGYHPLDGASYLRSLGQERLACLVAHYSEARFEGTLRGYGHIVSNFPREQSPVADALIYCDMTTGPTGEELSLEERLADMFQRYGETSLVAQVMQQARPTIELAVERTQRLLHEHSLQKKPAEIAGG